MRQNLRKDVNGNPVQAFVPDPAKSIAPYSLSGSVNLSSLIPLEDCLAVVIYSSADITRYFNANSTATRTIPAGQDTLILLDETVEEVVLAGTATIEIEAM